jgi:DNA-binding MarR family transcriptional regulator
MLSAVARFARLVQYLHRADILQVRGNCQVARESAVDAIVRALRRIDFHGEVLGQTIAVRLGLSESDVKALELLAGTHPVTAGRLAEMLNLSTGAVTRVLDRLEQAGYVRRTPDPTDRRRVVIEVVPGRLSAVRDALEPLGEAHAEVVAGYSDDELAVINDFLTKMADAERARAEAAREDPGSIGDEGVHRAPLGATERARLLVRSSAWNVTIDASAGAADLFRARFEGKQPAVRVRDDSVIVAYRGGMRDILDWRTRAARIGLNPAIPWAVVVHGGMSRARADLSSLELRSFELTGGADRLRLQLGRPKGAVPLTVTGGANDLRIERPADTAITLRLRGGANRVTLDDQRLGVATDVSLESTGASHQPDRFELAITGGANKVTVVSRSP